MNSSDCYNYNNCIWSKLYLCMLLTANSIYPCTANFPPLIYGPDSLYVTLGEEAVLVFNVTDDKGSINVILVDGLPAGATLLPTPKGDYTIEYTFRLELDEIADISLVFLATDDLDAGSTLEVQVCVIIMQRCVL